MRVADLDVQIDLEILLSELSKYSGYLSFTIWLFAQLPQIIENHLNQSVEGVNVAFLGCWIAGDLTNLIGCLLTKALPFQTLIASYYCFIDIILSVQFWYYKRVFPYHTTPHNLLQSPNMVRFSNTNPRVSPHYLKTPPNSNSLVRSILSAGLVSGQLKKARGAPIGHSEPILNSINDIGKIMAWICSCFYISSRVPQIFTNFKKKSTTGISPYLFLLAMVGNTLYAVSIASDLYLLFLKKDPKTPKVFSDQLPFLLGSGGTVMFDIIILFQIWCFKASHGRQHHHQHIRPRESVEAFDQIGTVGFQQQKPTEAVTGAFQEPDWYNNNFVYEDENEEFYNHSNILNESSSLVRAPHHYIAANSPLNNYGSLSNANSKVTARSLKIKSPNMSFGSHQSPSMGTALIPSIINSYSSLTKKMTDDQKTPFSPSDFLSDNLHHHVENSSFSLNN